MADFLLELLCEEIPARMQPKAKEDLARLFTDALAKAGLQAESVEAFATPRRLALIAKSLPLATEAVSEETKGPKVGAPPQALEGFLRKLGLSEDQLTQRDGVYFAVVEKPGRDTAEVLAEAIPAIIRAFPWPKSMRWGAASITTESLRWVRPLSGIIALLDGEVVPFAVDGIASGRTTMGHRFHHSGPVEIADAGSYVETLRAAHVIVHFSERCRIIREGAAKAAADAGLTLVADEGLVIENAGLTEWPVPLLGRFDEAFLDVPPEVIQLTARVNQKYFVCEGPDGKLANAFVCTANIDPRDPAVVVDGNRKVLAARLSDARFFWEQDQKTPLAVHAEKLSRITFHEKLGTVADKVERVAKLARWLCEEGVVSPASVRVERNRDTESGLSTTLEANGDEVRKLADMAEQAARLCKADLVTEMVGEFPELQGLMGGYYAAKEGLPVEVAEAIRDHYKPVGQGDDVPTAPVTVAVSLADKLDTLACFFYADMAPTGSKDPFALRRAAIGLLALLVANGIRLPLLLPMAIATGAATGRVRHLEFIYKVENLAKARAEAGDPMSDDDKRDSYQKMVDQVSSDLKTGKFDEKVLGAVTDLLDFLADRLKVQQREAGVRHDLIDAVFALGGEDDLVRLLARVHALQAFVTTEDGANLLAGYKRAANILKKEGVEPTSVRLERSRETGGEDVSTALDANGMGALSYTPEPAEKALIDALAAAAPRAAEAVEAEKFADAMAALATLRAPIDRFFEEVTVNDADANKRASRLALLAAFRDAVHRVADFSRIEG
ncbi:glycine--tRNA ligase subunit beta [Porphyrobacter sp. HT-58-2]|uniref:glycine--tRNA ligase subunit beta n=1 Tax=Porphyrobacter sp. HT-58-2 TaxID=2023229 RepID=UPI000CDC0102|nr:glycine--tRNA ligase subunit beta [Porphyrobacter sp. HT-58-2]AUX69910.1 glycine--tRNA ligase subunit beta [Porphyrobacter sp. HT-58-2]